MVVQPKQVDEGVRFASLEHPFDVLLVREVVAEHQVEPVILMVLLQVRRDGGPDQPVTSCYNDLHTFSPITTRVSPTPRMRERNLWDEMKSAALFFGKILNANIEKIAVENPIPHKYAVEIIGRKYDQVIQPWMFGHGETKATCLWLKGLPPLMPTNIVEGREARIHKMPPGPDRWKER